MLQDTSTNSVCSDTADDSIYSASRSSRRSPEDNQFSANTYAERLMDDLFQEVEQLLNLESSPLTKSAEVASGETLQPPPVPIEPEPERAMPLAPRLESLDLQALYATDEGHLTAADPVVAPNTPASAPTPTPTKTEGKINLLLLAVSCVSVVMAWGAWWLYQDGKQRQQAIVPPTDLATATNASGDPHFAAYLQKSLQHIDQHTSSASGVSSDPTKAVVIPGMPTVVIPKTDFPTSATSNSTSTDSGRVYVPVYKLPTNLYPPGASISPLPNLPKAKSPTVKSGPTVAKSDPSASVTRKLVGVLDQGDNSVALFEINGVTQRYEMGESIGSSGWTLVEVTKNQAIIRRNGDVRSLFVGNTF